MSSFEEYESEHVREIEKDYNLRKPYCLCNQLLGKRQCYEEDSSTKEELEAEEPEKIKIKRGTWVDPGWNIF